MSTPARLPARFAALLPLLALSVACVDDPAPAAAAAAETTAADSASDASLAPTDSDAPADAKPASKDVQLPDLGFGAWPDGATNQAPTAKWLEPAEGATLTAGASVTCKLQLGDDHTAFADLSVAVTLATGKVQVTGKAVDASGVLTFAAQYLPVGQHTMKVTVRDGPGELVAVQRVVHIQALPGAPQVAILPADPTTGVDLLVTLTVPAKDAAGQAIAAGDHSYTWLVDGELAEDLTGTVVPAARTTVGEMWVVRVQAKDKLGGTGKKAEAAVTIAKTPLQAPTLVLSPVQPTVADTVYCLGVPNVDADGAALSTSYQWSVDGVSLGAAATGSKLELAAVVDGKLTAKVAAQSGQALTCVVVLSDGATATLPAAVTATLAGIDPCALGVGGCPIHSTCTPGKGAEANCPCAVGFAADGTLCTDQNECVAGTATCPKGAVCTNTTGSYSCACGPGYNGDGKSCVDADECSNNSAACDPAADCSNTAGSYTCACKPGYVGDGTFCYDINECGVGLGGDPSAAACDLAAECSNSLGSYACTCKAGFSGNGKTCADIDECKASPAPCHLAADCSNTAGGYSCACKSGYEGSGLFCADVDECAASPALCSVWATCKNGEGDFSCKCDAGYVGNGAECVDADECKDGSAKCSASATCKNLPGGYDCICKAGFVGDGKTCTDIDECKAGTWVCDANATCQNGDGSYGCVCAKGYIGDGKICDDVDECATGDAKCHAAAICANTAGSYSCTCKAGWTGDGKSCAVK